MGTPAAPKRKLLLVAVFIAGSLLPLGILFFFRDPGRTRTPCNGATHVASPGYFSAGWCLQRQVSGTTIDAEGTESSYTSWGGTECYASEAEAREACARRTP